MNYYELLLHKLSQSSSFCQHKKEQVQVVKKGLKKRNDKVYLTDQANQLIH